MSSEPVIPHLQLRRPEKDHFNRKEAAAYLTRIGCPISPRTLENLAMNNNAGKGPPYTRMRWKTVVYNRVELEQWAERQKVRVE